MKFAQRLLCVLAPTTLLLQGCSSTVSTLPFAEKPPPTKVRDLGRLETEHLPVSRRTRAWFTKAKHQILNENDATAANDDPAVREAAGFIGYFDAKGTRLFDLPVKGQDAEHLTSTAWGAYFTMRGPDGDRIWFVDLEGWFKEFTGTPITVHAIRQSGSRMLVLGDSRTPPMTTVVYELDHEASSYRPIATVASTRPNDGSLLAVRADGFAFDYPASGKRCLHREDGTSHFDVDLGSALDYLGAVGDLYYSRPQGQDILQVTDRLRTHPIDCNGSAFRCESIVENGAELLVTVRGPSEDRVFGITEAGLVRYGFTGASKLHVHCLVAGQAVLALADDDSGRHVWRRNGDHFDLVSDAVGDSVRLLEEFDSGYVLATEDRRLVLQLSNAPPIEDKLPPAYGAIKALFVFRETVFVLAETKPGSTERTLYRW